MTGWVELTHDDVVRLHDAFLPGAHVRDENALRGAVAKPWVGYMGIELYPRLVDKAAALLEGLARNHPFADGNKRTAINACVPLLTVNGHPMRFEDDEEVASFVVEMAQGKVDHEVVAAWLTAHAARP